MKHNLAYLFSSPEHAQGELLEYLWTSETSVTSEMSVRQLLLVYTLEGTVLI